MVPLSYIFSGILIGLVSGFMGLGGGIIAIPILIYVFGLTQHQAQGTSLAMMVPPITLLAALRYYQSGNVKIGMAIFLASGFVVGGLVGAHICNCIPGPIIKRVFGIVLLLLSVRMIFFK